MSSAPEKQCYSLDLDSNAWIKVGAMTVGRKSAGTSMHPTRGLIMTGGLQGNQDPAIDLVESTMDGVSFDRSYARMPRALGGHCQVGPPN